MKILGSERDFRRLVLFIRDNFALKFFQLVYYLKPPILKQSNFKDKKFVETTKGGFMSRPLFVKQFSTHLLKIKEEEKDKH